MIKSNPNKPSGIEIVVRQKEPIKVESDLFAVNQNTGEIKELFLPGKTITLPSDKLIYCKVFRTSMDLVSKLPINSKVLLLFLTYVIKPNNDIVYLDPEEACLWCGFKIATYYRAVKGLVKGNVLTKMKHTNQYYINPNVFFNGNRLRLKQ